MATGVLGLAPKQNEVATYSATQAQASTPTAVGYKPNEFTVNKQSTVAGQLDEVIKQDSPLLQQARRRAELKSDQAMTDRGLLNSSLAVGSATEAADNALYERALPIAQQDATTYGTAATNTTNAQNAALYAKMQADNAAAMRAAELNTNVSLANADAATKADAATAGTANQFKQIGLETDRAYTLADKETARALQLADKEYQRAMATATLDANTRLQLANLDNATRLELANVDRNTRVELSTIENNYRQLLQLNQDAAAMYNQMSTNISNISASNLSQAAKDAAIRTQLNLLQEGLRAKQAIVGTPATPGTSPSGPTAPNVAALNIGQYFSGNLAKTEIDQKTYEGALAEYRRKVEERDASWKAWDQGGRSGPWNVPMPTPPNPNDFPKTGTSTTPPPSSTPAPSPTGTPGAPVVPPLSQPPPGIPSWQTPGNPSSRQF